MTTRDAYVCIVDDDSLIRQALESLFKSVGLKAYTFPSAQEFLEIDLPEEPCCLILDIRMPSMSGLDLQQKLAEKGVKIPIIFITGHGTVPTSVRAMKAGAVDFLQKPFEDQDLLDAAQRAIELNKQMRKEQAEMNDIKRGIKSLTSREYEVFVLVIAGLLNKQIAYDLDVSENTVKSHRASIMKKMNAESYADLIRFAEKADLETSQK
jgi:FixJ family two-component response regulator